MGAYVNPSQGSKEDWLQNNGQKMKEIPSWNHIPDEMLPVCLVDNGMFTAAAILFSARELEGFTNPRDHRPKKYFMVPIDKLLRVSMELPHYLSRH